MADDNVGNKSGPTPNKNTQGNDIDGILRSVEDLCTEIKKSQHEANTKQQEQILQISNAIKYLAGEIEQFAANQSSTDQEQDANQHLKTSLAHLHDKIASVLGIDGLQPGQNFDVDTEISPASEQSATLKNTAEIMREADKPIALSNLEKWDEL